MPAGILLCPGFPQHGDVPSMPARLEALRRHTPAIRLRHSIPPLIGSYASYWHNVYGELSRFFEA